MAKGTSLLALGSDLDIMHCYHDARIIHHTSDWEIKLDLPTFPGDTSDVHFRYCHLKGMNLF